MRASRVNPWAKLTTVLLAAFTLVFAPWTLVAFAAPEGGLVALDARAPEAGSRLAEADAGARLDGAMDAKARVSDAHDARAVDDDEDAAPEPPHPKLEVAPARTPLAEATADAAASRVDASAIPSSAPSSVPSVAPAPSAASTDGAFVRLRDRKLFQLRAGHGGVTPAERARKATASLDAAFEKNLGGEVKIDESEPGVATIVLDGTPIVQLTYADAVAAGDATLGVHAVATAEIVRGAVKAERTRHDVATTVFHWSLAVLTGLLGFLVQRRLRRLLRAARIWLRRHPEKIPAFRVARIDLVRPTALLGLLQLTAAFLDRVIQGTVLYVWLVFSLSLFERTQGASATISGFVVKPLGALAGRIATSLPSLVGLFATFVLTFVVVRFVSQVEKAVERGEAELPGLSKDLTKPVLVIVRLSIVLFALLVGAPVVSGNDDAVLSKVGLALVGALALASAPIFASAGLGLVALFSGRYKVGEYVSFDGRQGRLLSISLLELRMRDGEGAELRIPHLLALTRDVRILGAYRLASFEIVVDAKANLEEARAIIVRAARSRHGDARVRLLGVHAKGARFEVVARRGDGEDDSATAVAMALRDAEIALGEIA